ncbi:hypothetical protein DLAC_05902 [Tieghemostelium lacteum]|uniref:LIM zinc-binding domain-containing protein n=1 Tax=Tieghemostelium lacteum TaxID=361077 RepID=A0A151ZH97_TIELA|nr:hypothetical protein DLAC_05902 [Tieghemostelium lacteum]|eukprot:KYQ93250.1 hypothetical protein DLAC_05902 [Tieghemostelium lacteum]
MSSVIGNCKKCTKKVYPLEGFMAAKSAFHKSCFKCEICGWQLTLTNYKSINDKVYCKNHYPVTGFGVEDHVTGKTTTDSKVLADQINTPKLDTVNQQVRGTGDKPMTDLESMHINKAISAPKLDTVNQQVRGTGDKPMTDLESMHINKAISAPKLDTVNQQVRGTGESNITLDTIAINKATSVPKLDTEKGYQKNQVN